MEKKKPVQRKSQKDKFVEEVNSADTEVLRKCIIRLGTQDVYFRRQAMSIFEAFKSIGTIASYKKILNQVVNANKTHGFIHYRGMKNVGSAFQDLLELADSQTQDKNFRQAIYIYLAVVDVANKVVNFSDDSAGEISDAMNTCFLQLFELAEEGFSEEDKKYLFKYAAKIYEKGSYRGWDWHYDMLCLCSLTCKDRTEAEKMLEIMAHEEVDGYSKDVSERYYYSFLRKFFSRDEANKYFYDHFDNDQLREMVIKGYIAKDDLEKAKNLALKSIEIDRKNRPGLISRWERYLLDIALKQSDIEKAIHFARNLFIDSQYPKDEYYKTLKNLVPIEKWNYFVDGLIQDLSRKQPIHHEFEELAKLLVSEDRLDVLMQKIEEKPTFNILMKMEPFLKGNYAGRIANLYADLILVDLKYAGGRNQYKQLCKYITRIKNLGQDEVADGLVVYIIDNYPHRTALMEELGRV